MYNRLVCTGSSTLGKSWEYLHAFDMYGHEHLFVAVQVSLVQQSTYSE